MSEKQKQLVKDITNNVKKLPIEKQYQLLGVAQGLGMVPVPGEDKPSEGQAEGGEHHGRQAYHPDPERG